MTRYFVHLRYYPGDPLEDIKMDDLKTLEKEYGVNISWAKKENREMKDGLLMERTLDKRIEDITQEVITVASDQEENFPIVLSPCIKNTDASALLTACWAATRPARKLPKN
jgi:hypothetical protein